jgi:aminoglycoside 6'-N-acetyltransferase I
MIVRLATATDITHWAALRIALWDWDTIGDHRNQAEEPYLAGNPDRAAFVALDAKRNMIGFAEATIRRDYVEGCESWGVAFLEGIYVQSGARKAGVARALSEAVAEWGRAQGCTEYASNALLDN